MCWWSTSEWHSDFGWRPPPGRGVTPAGDDAAPLWAIAWRTRSAAWMLRQRRTLEYALA